MRLLKICIMLGLVIINVGCMNKEKRVELERIEDVILVENKVEKEYNEDYLQTEKVLLQKREELLQYLKGKIELPYEYGLCKIELGSIREEIKSSYETEKEIREEREEEMESIEEYVESRLIVKELKNISKGVLQQEIIVKLPYGVKRGITLKWLKGDLLDYERYIN